MRSSISFLLIIILAITACDNPNAVVDVQQTIEDGNWTYTQKIKVPVKIEDNRIPYNVYINLRHTADYKYANIYIRIREIGPAKMNETFRKEFTLANPDGEWLGTGSGNLYNYQLPIKKNYLFPHKGTYVFVLEQNMRDNPLREITDVGLRVEKAQ